VARLDHESSTALGLAVKQCLVNVLKHSGTTQAEVAVYGSEADVSVMVVDTGKGFMETETGADRLGLRNSVRRRIEAIEGTVQVWSTPGRGTSIMIRVPADVASESEEMA
jgi:signal transduction histidine kinase